MQLKPAVAYYADYSQTSYFLITIPTVDGKWTSTDEWDDSIGVYNGSFHFRSKWAFTTSVWEYFLIEIYTDNTNDPGDYWQLCVDALPNGGTFPQTDDIRIDCIGHSNTTGLHFYNGTGAVWSESVVPTAAIQVVDSIASSKLSGTPHWICEIAIDKLALGIQADYWMRVAVYDANTSTLYSWPPTSPDVPDNYGLSTASYEAVPEGIGLGVMVLSSFLAVLVGYYIIRKRSRNGSFRLGKKTAAN